MAVSQLEYSVPALPAPFQSYEPPPPPPCLSLIPHPCPPEYPPPPPPEFHPPPPPPKPPGGQSIPGEEMPVTLHAVVRRVVPIVTPPELPAKNDFPPKVSSPARVRPSPPFARKPPPPPPFAWLLADVPATPAPPAAAPPPPPPPALATAVAGLDLHFMPEVPVVASTPALLPTDPPPPAARMRVCCPAVANVPVAAYSETNEPPPAPYKPELAQPVGFMPTAITALAPATRKYLDLTATPRPPRCVPVCLSASAPPAPPATISYQPVVPTVQICMPLGMVWPLTVVEPDETVTSPRAEGMADAPE